MDLQDPVAHVRLKFFLARQAERRRSMANPQLRITPRPAAILAALALTERYSEKSMTGGELGRLFGLSPSGLSNRIGELKSQSLVEKDVPYYRINSEGLRVLGRFADEVLGIPQSVEAELGSNDTYRESIKVAESAIDEYLIQKFKTARRRRKTPRQPMPAMAPTTSRDLIRFSWEQAVAAAVEIGRKVFDEFRADVILTFAGHGAIFANLVLATHFAKNRAGLLNTPVYLAMVRDVNPTAPMPMLRGFDCVPDDNFEVLLPEAFVTALRADKNTKVAVIDDVIASGVVAEVLRRYFRKTLGCPKDRAKVACWLFHDGAWFQKERRADYPEKPNLYTREFTLPWGDPLWFPYYSEAR